MDLIKCPYCGEEYSSSYPRCPFCEEDDERPRKLSFTPTHRVADRKKTQSARGGLIVVLILVLALLSWYLFGGSIIERVRRTEEPDDTQTSQQDPAVPVSNDDPFYRPSDDAQNTAEPGGETADPVTDPLPLTDPGPGTDPGPDEDVDVSNAKLNREDFTLNGAGDSFRVQVSGTEATPRWSIDNANVATIGADGTVTAVANGNTTLRCKVGVRELTCVVRVNNTGRTAAPADSPTAAEPVTPAAPATPPATTGPSITEPSTSTTPVNAASLKIKTNLTGVLPKDGDRFDCTVSIGGDVIRLIVIDADGKAVDVSWTSNDPSVATISENGTISPLQSGKRTVMTATVGDATVECIIRVR